MLKDAAVQSLRKIIDEVGDLEPDALLNRPELGSDLSFLDLESDVVLARQILDDLRCVDLSLLGEDQITTLSQGLGTLLQALDLLRKFAIAVVPEGQPVNPVERRNNVVRSFMNATGHLMKFMGPVGYLLLHDKSAQATIARHVGEAQGAALETTRSATIAGAKNAEIDQILAKVRGAAGLTGVGIHAQSFGTAATDHDTLAKAWIRAGCLLGDLVVAVVMILALCFPIDRAATAPQLAQYVVSRASTIGLLAYAALFCVRNYRSHRHLAVVNGHRQNALSTFETFVKAAGADEQTKAKILEEATRCIFAATTTGYLADDPEPNRIVEVIKSFGGAAPR